MSKHLWGWCWGCCHGYCSPAAASPAGCSGRQSSPSWVPGSSWGWRSGCTGCRSWWGFRSCWTAPTGVNNREKTSRRLPLYQKCSHREAGAELNTDTEAFVWPAARERWPEWTAAAGRRSLQTRCPVWSYAATTNRPNLFNQNNQKPKKKT